MRRTFLVPTVICFMRAAVEVVGGNAFFNELVSKQVTMYHVGRNPRPNMVLVHTTFGGNDCAGFFFFEGGSRWKNCIQVICYLFRTGLRSLFFFGVCIVEIFTFPPTKSTSCKVPRRMFAGDDGGKHVSRFR